MNEIKVNLENLTDAEREQLLALVEKANKPKNKDWKPQPEEEYWTFDSCGRVVRIICDSPDCPYHEFDEWNIKSGFRYKTEEEAEFAKEKMFVTQELQDFADEHNEKELDWKGFIQCKYFIRYDYSLNTIVVPYNTCIKGNDIYFSSEEIARAAVEAVGEDRVKKYYLGVEDAE